MISAVVTDDSPATRRILIKILANLPITIVAEAGDAEAAVAACIEHVPDLLFLDVVMPGATGVEVLRRVSAMQKGIGVIMVTSIAEREIVHTCRDLGAIGYVLKPFSKETILTNIASLCHARVPPSVAEDACTELSTHD
jgi:DNA-binding NarL/FixJ family response regulator